MLNKVVRVDPEGKGALRYQISLKSEFKLHIFLHLGSRPSSLKPQHEIQDLPLECIYV